MPSTPNFLGPSQLVSGAILGMQLYTCPHRASQAANRAIARGRKRQTVILARPATLARCQKWVAAAHSVKPVLILIRSGAVPPSSAPELGVDGLLVIVVSTMRL